MLQVRGEGALGCRLQKNQQHTVDTDAQSAKRLVLQVRGEGTLDCRLQPQNAINAAAAVVLSSGVGTSAPVVAAPPTSTRAKRKCSQVLRKEVMRSITVRMATLFFQCQSATWTTAGAPAAPAKAV